MDGWIDAHTSLCLVSMAVMVLCRMIIGEDRRHKGEEDAGVLTLDIITVDNHWRNTYTINGEDQPATAQMSPMDTPLDHAQDVAMPLVECALTPMGHCRPIEA